MLHRTGDDEALFGTPHVKHLVGWNLLEMRIEPNVTAKLPETFPESKISTLLAGCVFLPFHMSLKQLTRPNDKYRY